MALAFKNDRFNYYKPLFNLHSLRAMLANWLTRFYWRPFSIKTSSMSRTSKRTPHQSFHKQIPYKIQSLLLWHWLLKNDRFNFYKSLFNLHDLMARLANWITRFTSMSPTSKQTHHQSFHKQIPYKIQSMSLWHWLLKMPVLIIISLCSIIMIWGPG